jgi:hypothetical protein
MLFKILDFHVHLRDWGEEDLILQRPFRLRINYVLDSFTLRIPKKVRTHRIRKLNVCANKQRRTQNEFWDLEGIANVELTIPEIESIYFLNQSQAAEQVTNHLRAGIEIACSHDSLFAEHRNLCNELLSTTNQEFDYESGISRVHRTRRWRCDTVLRIGANKYSYDLLVREMASQETIQRYTIKTTDCLLPLFDGVGFSKLRWEKQEIIGFTSADAEAFRFRTGLPA